MTGLPSWRWLATQLELTAAVACTALGALLVVAIVTAPGNMGPAPSDVEVVVGVGVRVAALLAMTGATLWMFRISQADD